MQRADWQLRRDAHRRRLFDARRTRNVRRSAPRRWRASDDAARLQYVDECLFSRRLRSMKFRSTATDDTKFGRRLRPTVTAGAIVLAVGVGYTLHAARAG